MEGLRSARVAGPIFATPNARISIAAIAAVCFLSFLLSSIPVALGQDDVSDSPRDMTPLVFSTGPDDGEYYRLGGVIAERLRAAGLQVEVVPSNGSRDNLRALQAGDADLALVQSNILADTRLAVEPIMSLTTEKVHLVVGRSLTVSAIEQLAGKRIFLGLPGSGSRITALDILGSAGLSPHEVTSVSCSTNTEAVQKLESGEIDVAFFTISHPATILEKSVGSRAVRLLPVGKTPTKQLLNEFPCYVSADIPAEAYGLDEDVRTVGARSILLAGRRVTNNQAYTIAKTIFSNWRNVTDELGYTDRLTPASAHSCIDRPMHPGAERYYSDNRLRSLIPSFDRSWAILFAVIAVLVYIVGWQKRVLRTIWRQPVLASVLALALAWFLGAVGMYFAERNVNVDFDPLTEALWSVVVYLFSGFEDKYPLTEAGRVVTVAIMLVGAGCLAIITASIAATLTKRGLEEKRMPGKLKGHFVICNCDNRIFSIIREIQSKNSKEKVPIVVVSTRRDVRLHGRKEDDEFLEDVFSVVGDPTDPRVLLRVNAQSAGCVIILAQKIHVATDGDSDKSETELDDVAADARTLMTLMAMKKICKETAEDPNDPAYVNCVVEILDPRNMDMAWEIGTKEEARDACASPAETLSERRGFYGANRWVQVVSAGEMQTLLICQAAHTPGLVRFYRRLMTFTGDTNEVYIVPVPKALCKEPTYFREAVAWITSASRDGNPVIPVGIQQADGSQKTNPGGTTVLTEDQRLMVIALDEPDLEQLDTSLLKRIRELRS